MDNYSQYRELNFAALEAEKKKERTKIRRASNIIGVAFIALWLLPSVYSGIIVEASKIFGFREALADIFTDPAFLMVYQTAVSILLFVPPFLIIPFALGKSVSGIASFKKPNKELFLPLILVGVGATAFANTATNTIAEFFDGIGITFLSPDIEYPTGDFGFILSFLAIAVTPALVEEFANRGMIMGAAREFGEGFALIISSVFFSLMHGNLVQIPFALVMGFVIGFAVIKTGSLITGIVIHFINNAMSVILDYIFTEVESVFLQNGIVTIYFGICIILMFIGIYLAQKRCENVWSLEKSETALSLGEKLRCVAFSPAVIVSFGLAAIDCISSIQI